MLFPKRTWSGLADGSVTVAFRRWRRPTVKAGGTLRTPAGLLSIDTVQIVDESAITDEAARAAGEADAAAVRAQLHEGEDRTLYRITFHPAGPDPRVALREAEDLSEADAKETTAALQRLDRASRDGPWTAEVLDLIQAHEGVRAPDLAEMVGEVDITRFKRRVRRVKALGLTESLRVGYRLSPRGRAYLATSSHTGLRSEG